MNICKYYKEGRYKSNMYKNNSEPDTYSALVDAVGFKRDNDKNEGTYYYKLKSGLKSYISSRGYTVTVDSYLLSVWADFERDFDAGYPNIIYLEGNIYDKENKKWITAGHFVVGVGYRVSYGQEIFVQVCDGWNPTTERYVEFCSEGLTTYSGAAVKVS